mgnify:CR=1 FL=1
MVKQKLFLLMLTAMLSVSLCRADDSIYVYRYSEPVNFYGMQYLESIWANMQKQYLEFSFPKDVFEQVPDSQDPGYPDLEWDPTATDVQRDVIRRLLSKMVYVQGGYTMMGAQNYDISAPNYYEFADPRESPVHKVYLSSFRMNRYEITRYEYDVIMSIGEMSSENNYAKDGLSWHQAQAFIDRINQLCRMQGLRFSLPSEAQWEYAARGGGRTRGYEYSGSNVATQVGWITANSGMRVHTTGELLPNELGIYDMTGNVYEWCQDWYGDYSTQDNIDPTGPSTGSLKVCRGGCYMTPESASRNAWRMNYPPDETTVVVLGTAIPTGIRLVLVNAPAQNYLIVSTSSITAAPEGGVYSVNVQSGQSFYVDELPSWCSVTTGPGVVYVTVDANHSGEFREGVFKVKTGGGSSAVLSYNVSVSQDYTPHISAVMPTPEELAGRITWRSDATPAQREAILQLLRNMVCVYGDKYYMGAQNFNNGSANFDPNAGANESPVHQVSLSSYYLNKYEVTRQQYKDIMGSDPSYFTYSWQFPVENLSWQDAQAFVDKINQLCGLTFCLPTEAQWEFAARGGREGHKAGYGFIYSGSNTPLEVGWLAANSDTNTHDVGSLKANELGIYDMTGNVCEWCSDWFHAYEATSDSQWNPTGPQQGSEKVGRGGIYILAESFARNSTRLSYVPDSHTYLGIYTLPVGVRLALDYTEEVNLTVSKRGDRVELLNLDDFGGAVRVIPADDASWWIESIKDYRLAIVVSENSSSSSRQSSFYVNTYAKRLKVNIIQTSN